jgi:hypothetical protein
MGISWDFLETEPQGRAPASAEAIVRTLPASSMALTAASLQCGVRFSIDLH